MITEEQLKNVLDSLRLGKYDTPDYKIDAWIGNLNKGGNANLLIKNKETKNVIQITLCTHITHWWPFGIHFITKCKKPYVWIQKYTIDDSCTSGIVSDIVSISDKLVSSFISYITERSEQDKLICETNVNREFNL